MSYFTGKDTWNGGFFELAIELGDRSTDRLNAALREIWKYPHVTGAYLRRDIEPHVQTPASPALATGDQWPLDSYGLARLEDGKTITCGTCVVRETDGPDWLKFYFPMGALEDAYQIGGYPFMNRNTPTPWLLPLERWLADLGLWLADRVTFRCAIVGYETSGAVDAQFIRSQGGIPTQRSVGYLWPEEGQFKYFASNE